MFYGKGKIRNILFIIIVLAAVTVFYFYSQPGSSMDFTRESFTLNGPENTDCTFVFDDITSISLEEDMDYGTPVSGGTVFGGNMYGTWENDNLGTYNSFASEKISSCIIIADHEKTAVFNYENEDTTSAVYNSLLDYWPEQ